MECLELQKFNVGANKFLLERHIHFMLLIVLFFNVLCLDFIEVSSTYFPFLYLLVFPAGALWHVAYGFPVGVTLRLECVLRYYQFN